MDETQVNLTDDNNGSPAADEPILPPVQSPALDESEEYDEDDGPDSIKDPQTVPTDRALVPSPEEAADSDLIEKEWVLKAKQIVEHTSEDPYAQTEELSRMKADYMKKRYNKDIGVT